MRLNEVVFGGVPVDGYGPGFFRVGGVLHTGPLALLPVGAVEWPGLPEVKAFLDRASAIDVLLIGMGAEIAALDPAPLRALEEAGLGVEVMATAPACRTYNVLLGEGRRVALAALPV
ncbi:MAG: Mth938-like domain-containing protein [Pseudomonadota bacterium]